MSFLIVSRDFWPNAAAIGDGLMGLARLLSKTDKVSVVTMSRQDLSALDRADCRGVSKILFFIVKPLTNSSSHFLLRILELIYFSLWLLVSLFRARPSVVYVATNPPILVPFVVAVYCKLFNSKYVYHVQDIHPEAASLLVKMPGWVFSTLQSIDAWTLNNACRIITLTEDMKKALLSRAIDRPDIMLMENPSVVLKMPVDEKIQGIVFSGNAGRLQLMDIVLGAIEQYLRGQGTLDFCFVGGGVYKGKLLDLSKKYKNFSYKGYVDGATALKITCAYRWALLPILPEVLSFAYPSKIPAYLSAGCEIISVTDHDTALAKWVESSGCGRNVKPSVEALIGYFQQLEMKLNKIDEPSRRAEFSTPESFSKNLQHILKGCKK